MPIEYRIDREQRRVLARSVGTLTDEDVFRYQYEVWSRPDVAGYDELMDMSDVGEIVVPSATRIRELAQLSADMDPRTGPTRFAIVAPSDLSFGLGKMFESFRDVMVHGTRQVGVFRTMEDALAFLRVGAGAAPSSEGGRGAR